MSHQEAFGQAGEGIGGARESAGGFNLDLHLKKCLVQVSSFVSRWADEIREARSAADGVWKILPGIDIIRPLNIAYYVISDDREEIRGRIRSQVTQISEKGHNVVILHRDDKLNWLDKPFSRSFAGTFLKVPKDATLNDIMPQVDVVVGTSWMSMWDLMLCKNAEPVVFEMEERTFDLLRDPVAFGSMMELPVPLVSFSEPVFNTFLLYGRESVLPDSVEDVERILSLFARMHRGAREGEDKAPQGLV
ncbi:MAG: hypothetical protein IMF26_02690 [Candidatus Fermentithermobacillus carboniphilus]|uniref:Uncharacterized protein n=1 Tax=Candidatus Fermentithermobacillus carboniphilus TaxID=3085328 RepID=A0AAT9LCZ0_9FIRM|nr:MAG: hypothetical protein IMF26_02690 [Candidatus Fermentithermobacillus carboniphilus]